LGIDDEKPPQDDIESEEWHWLYNSNRQHLPDIKIVKPELKWQICTVTFEEIKEGDNDYIDISA
jgi:hypothetical protein